MSTKVQRLRSDSEKKRDVWGFKRIFLVTVGHCVIPVRICKIWCVKTTIDVDCETSFHLPRS